MERFLASAQRLQCKLVGEGHVFSNVEAEIRLHPLHKTNAHSVIKRLQDAGWRTEKQEFIADRVCTSNVRHRVIYCDTGEYKCSEIVCKRRVGKADKWRLGRSWGALASVSLEEPTNISACPTKHVRLIDRVRLVMDTCSSVVIDISMTKMGASYESALAKQWSLEVEIETTVGQNTDPVSVRACINSVLELFM